MISKNSPCYSPRYSDVIMSIFLLCHCQQLSIQDFLKFKNALSCQSKLNTTSIHLNRNSYPQHTTAAVIIITPHHCCSWNSVFRYCTGCTLGKSLLHAKVVKVVNLKLKGKNTSGQQAEKGCWETDGLLQTRGIVFIHFSFEITLSICIASVQMFSPHD